MNAFTPGPWKTCQNGNCTCGQVWSIPGDCPVFTVLLDGRPQLVGLACNEWGDSPDAIYGAVGKEQQTANARLIAAAPDLLAIAREYADSCLDCSGSGTVQRYDTDDSDCAVTEFVDCPECAHVRAVIAAVEGA